MLIPVATDIPVFHDLILPHAEIRFVKGRVKFKGYNSKGEYVTNKTGQTGSMFVIFKEFEGLRRMGIKLYNDYEMYDYLESETQEGYDPTIKKWVNEESLNTEIDSMIAKINRERVHSEEMLEKEKEEYVKKGMIWGSSNIKMNLECHITSCKRQVELLMSWRG